MDWSAQISTKWMQRVSRRQMCINRRYYWQLIMDWQQLIRDHSHLVPIETPSPGHNFPTNFGFGRTVNSEAESNLQMAGCGTLLSIMIKALLVIAFTLCTVLIFGVY
eukprot:scaffold128559_cov71-Attheya_sp.AAC.2